MLPSTKRHLEQCIEAEGTEYFEIEKLLLQKFLDRSRDQLATPHSQLTAQNRKDMAEDILAIQSYLASHPAES
ncbi:MAG: hypothetical protein WCD18_01730 [Thermosynechococcaceae cyanobacterium]